MDPNDHPSDEQVARNRFMVMSLARLIGASIAILGVLALAEVLPSVPQMLGLALAVLGLAVMIGVPQAMARNWRTPPE